jgi:hypothetical protein
MKPKAPILLLAVIIALCTPVQAGWFGWSDSDVNRLREEHQKQLSAAGQQITTQRKAVETWELIAGSLAIGCPLLLIIGTALGTRTRHASSRTAP